MSKILSYMLIISILMSCGQVPSSPKNHRGLSSVGEETLFAVTDRFRENVARVEESLDRGGHYFVDEDGRKTGILSLIQKGSDTIRMVMSHENGGQFGFVTKGSYAQGDNRMNVQIALYDESFKNLYTARSLSLDLKAGQRENEAVLRETSEILQRELGKKFSDSSSFNPIRSLFSIVIPTAYARGDAPMALGKAILGATWIGTGVITIVGASRSKTPAGALLGVSLGMLLMGSALFYMVTE